MAKYESAWKQMINYYRTDYQEKHAPMVYGNVWLKTKSHQRLILGITDSAVQTLGTVTEFAFPTIGEHLTAGESLATIIDDHGQHVITTPFSGTVQKINTALNTDLTSLATNKQAKNWLVQLKAD